MTQWYLYPLLGAAVGVVASFCGLGGGFIMVPVLLLLGFEAQRAVGTTFVMIMLVALSALFAHTRLENVDWRMGLLLGIGGAIGAQLGPALLEFVPTNIFKKIFALLLIFVSLRLLLGR